MASPQSWTKSATAIVRDIFASKRYLKAQDIWKIGTADTRPIMQPTTAIDQWGRIRMKRVSNIREGRRVWVPPPVAPMPHHPFQAMRFLKLNILKALEAQNLIHQVKLQVPITDAEGILEAERSAMRRYRRMVFEATKYGKEPPLQVPEPRTTNTEYYYTLGPAPDAEKGESNMPVPQDEPITPDEIAAKMPAEGWRRAEALEKAYHEAKALENELIAARKAIRKARYLQEREEQKREKEELRESGLINRMRQEKVRAAAIASIEKYAMETGEDVSDWFDEIENAELPDDARTSFGEVINPKRVDGKLRLTPDVPRKNPRKNPLNRR